MFKVLDLVTGEVLEWSLTDVLTEINRDHDKEWIDFDASDWREGWKEFVQDSGLYRMCEQEAD
jgi:hypothetical protein